MAPQSSNPLKWVLLGCGGFFFLVVLGAAGLGYLAFKGTKSLMAEFSEIGDAGAAWIRTDPTLAKELGAIQSVEHRAMNRQVNYVNGHGKAHFNYGLRGEKGSGEAEIWMDKPVGGTWTVSGAILTTSDQRLIKVGAPPQTPKVNWKVD